MALNKVDTYDSNQLISVVDAADISGASVLEIRAAIVAASLQPVAEVKTGKRGRPPKLFARDALLSAIETARTAPATKVPSVASEVASDLAADSSEVDEFDSAVA